MEAPGTAESCVSPSTTRTRLWPAPQLITLPPPYPCGRACQRCLLYRRRSSLGARELQGQGGTAPLSTREAEFSRRSKAGRRRPQRVMTQNSTWRGEPSLHGNEQRGWLAPRAAEEHLAWESGQRKGPGLCLSEGAASGTPPPFKKGPPPARTTVVLVGFSPVHTAGVAQARGTKGGLGHMHLGHQASLQQAMLSGRRRQVLI